MGFESRLYGPPGLAEPLLVSNSLGNHRFHSYQGDWRKGAMHGAGTYRFADDSEYAGGWSKGRRHGKVGRRGPELRRLILKEVACGPPSARAARGDKIPFLHLLEAARLLRSPEANGSCRSCGPCALFSFVRLCGGVAVRA